MSTFRDPRAVLRQYGFAPKRGYSQNFLTEPRVHETIAAALGAGPTHRVVEFGPGVGSLTQALLARGSEVTAIEPDGDMRHVLANEFVGEERSRLTVVDGDGSRIPLADLAREQPLYVVGNIPYAITGAILRNVVTGARHVARCVLLVQREVEERLRASPGTREYGALTVFVQGVFEVHHVTRVAPGAFHPPPRVESAVVRLDPKAEPLDVDEPEFVNVVHAIFQSRRKTLRNSLRQGGWSPERIQAATTAVGIRDDIRGEMLSPEQIAALAHAPHH